MTTTGTVGEVVVGVDGSPGAAAALDWALAEAARRRVRLRAVLAWQPHARLLDAARSSTRSGGRDPRAEVDERVGATLGHAVAQAQQRTGITGVDVTTALVEGHVVQTLVGASGPEVLLVTGARGRGPVHGLLLGSVSQSVVQYAHGPVVVVPRPDGRSDGPRADGARAEGRRVVVGVDGSAASQAALAFALDAARSRDARLHVVHAWMDTVSGYGGPPWAVPRQTLEEEAREVLQDSVATLGDEPGADVLAETIEGLEYGVLLDAAEDADLLVVGARGRGGWKGLLLGSVGAHCVAAARCPVAVVRSPARG